MIESVVLNPIAPLIWQEATSIHGCLSAD